MDWSTLQNQSQDLYTKLHALHVEFYKLWVDDMLFTWRWWVSVSFIVLPWGIWFFLKKKDCTDRLLFAGLFVMVFSSALDMVGIAFNLWYYPVNVFPLMPEFIPYDICALPVTTMIFIQYFPAVNPFIKAALYSVIGSMAFQPLNKWMGLYQDNSWKDYYSIPILFGIYLTANYLATRNNFGKLG